MPGKGICGLICCTHLVNDFVLQAGELGIHFELPWGVKPLVIEVHESAMVRKDNKFSMLQITPPLIDSY